MSAQMLKTNRLNKSEFFKIGYRMTLENVKIKNLCVPSFNYDSDSSTSKWKLNL